MTDDEQAPADVTIGELDELERTTIRLPRSVVALIEKKAQNPLQMTSDAIPVALLAKALPFVDREITVELPPDSKLQPALPFRSESPATSEALVVPVARPAVPAVESEAAPLDVAAVATIAAEIVGGSTDAYTRHGLTAEAWLALEESQFARIAAALERGDGALRDAYDAAFLAARARTRGDFGERALAELETELAKDCVEDASPAMGNDIADAARYRRARRANPKSSS